MPHTEAAETRPEPSGEDKHMTDNTYSVVEFCANCESTEQLAKKDT